MANWLNQLQSLLGQKGASASPSGEHGLNKLLVPGALGGLAGLLVANKSSRKLLTKYGTGALLVGAARWRVPYCGISTKIKYAPRIRGSRNSAAKVRRWMFALSD